MEKLIKVYLKIIKELIFSKSENAKILYKNETGKSY